MRMGMNAFAVAFGLSIITPVTMGNADNLSTITSEGVRYLMEPLLVEFRKKKGVDESLFSNIEAMTTEFENLLSGTTPADMECDPKAKEPVLKDCSDIEKTMKWYFESVKWNACQFGIDTIEMEAGELVTSPMGALLTICFEESDLTSVESSPFCVERFRDGDYDGDVPIPDDIPGGKKGGTNQYAWATDFNEELGLGIVIHSTGSGGAIAGSYSLPTFTVRDADTSIVFEGIFGDTSVDEEDITIGLRSATIIGLQNTTLTIVAASIGVPNGEFLEFELDLSEYTDMPVLVDEPTRRSTVMAPSVRSILPLSDNLILYAPLFDIGGSPGFSFLKLFDTETFETLPTDLMVSDDSIEDGLIEAAQLPGLVWDFECQKEGLCFINTVSNSPPEDESMSNLDTIPVLSYFPLSFVEDFISQDFNENVTMPDTVLLPSTVLQPQFTVDYSAQSFEPIDATSSLVCTLSGFLFRVGFAGTGIFGDLLTGKIGIDFLELGQGQECNICTGELPEEERRDLKRDREAKAKARKEKRKRKKKAKNVQETSDGNSTVVMDEEFVKEKKKQKRKKKKAQVGCRPVELVDQPLSTAYVWAVEECGGKVFVGTYDIASVFGGIIGEVFVSIASSLACTNDSTVQAVCRRSSVPCTGNMAIDTQICLGTVGVGSSTFVNNSPSIRQGLESLLDTYLIGSPVTPGDFGFDLYYIEKGDLLAKEPQLQPVTQNGFRFLSPPEGFDRFASFFPYSFDPTTQADPAIRNMVCHRDPISGVEKLVIGSAVFDTGLSSNTYVLDPNCTTEA